MSNRLQKQLGQNTILTKIQTKFSRWFKNMYDPNDRYCPIFKKEIDSEVCYEIVMCLTCGFKATSVPEVNFKNDETTRKICDNCPYSNLE